MTIKDLDDFTIHYLIAALWSSHDDEHNPLDMRYDTDDIAESTLRQAKEDCDAFREMAGLHLDKWTDEQAGHDFWLTRCGHGAGFFDRGHGVDGDILTALCERFRNLDPVVGDDGKIYFE